MTWALMGNSMGESNLAYLLELKDQREDDQSIIHEDIKNQL